jgi:23S rRNA pseudouridine1911/1915/1917 synthase
VTERGAPGDADDLDDDDDGDDGDDGDERGGEAAPITAHHAFAVVPGAAGERIDALIAATVPALSRAQVQRLIDDAHVRLNGATVAKAGQRVRAGDAVAVDVPPPVAVELVAEDLPLAILYEDSQLIAIDKPAGLVVHPAAGHPRGTLVNALLHHCHDLSGVGGALRPGIVHRLDKDTSGAMVATKTDRAHAALAAAFAAKSRGEPGGIVREYLGIAAPAPPATAGTLRTLHGRHPTDRKRFSSKVTSGKPAVTHWTVVEPLPGAALVRFRLETGRTHQIRVHAADHGWPLLGDPLYGRTPRALAAIATALGRQALHAELLALDHPVSGARLRLEAPLPADLAAALAALRARAT